MQGVRADHAHKVRIAFSESGTGSLFSYASCKRAVASESTGAKNRALSRFKRTVNGSLPRRSRFSAKPDGTHPSAERRMATPYAFSGGIPPRKPVAKRSIFSSGNECGVRKGFSPPRLRRLSPASAAESKRKFSLQNKMIAIYFIIVGYFLFYKLYFLR